jgi:REP element-mobilizing transposase RayT
MTLANRHHRKSIRLKEYDYSSAGEYFVTICTYNHECFFGDIVNEEMRLNDYGEIANRNWKEISTHFSNVKLDESVVMPNHIHGILVLLDHCDENFHVGVQYIEPLQNTFQHVIPKSLGSIIRTYKAAVTRECRKRGLIDFQWQRNYYEHIIRDDNNLNNTREYIANNVLKWASDNENPENVQLH